MSKLKFQISSAWLIQPWPSLQKIRKVGNSENNQKIRRKEKNQKQEYRKKIGQSEKLDK